MRINRTGDGPSVHCMVGRHRKRIDVMSRRTRILAAIVVGLAVAYAASPWWVAVIVAHELSALHLTHVRVRTGYPGPRRLHLGQVEFRAATGAQDLVCNLTDVNLTYTPAELLAGKIAAVRVHKAAVQVRSKPRPAPTPATVADHKVNGSMMQALATVLSGKWLAQIPIDQVHVDEISAHGNAAGDTAYALSARASLQAGTAELTGEVQAPAPRLRFLFTARTGGRMHLAVSAAGASGKPLFDWTGEPFPDATAPTGVRGNFAMELHPLAGVLRAWLAAGSGWTQVQGRIEGVWRAAFPAAAAGNGIELSLQGLRAQGSYKDIKISGVRADARLAFANGVRTLGDARLRVAELDAGLPVRNIDVRFALTPNPKTAVPVVRVRQANAALLGGQARAGPFALDFAAANQRVTVRLQGIGVDELMKLERQEGLAGSGVLDGTLPLEIASAGVRVVKGRLSARSPGGTIRYRPTEAVTNMVRSNAGLKIAVDALANFHYQKLDAQADYHRDGRLVLRVHLEGENPDWQSGQPLHLNLNVEENIPMLLRSLRLGGEITERVRKHYQETQ
jgi:hypothetical protein